ncbi:MAG TPA: hypothetical protein VFH52_04690 [Rhodanobacteraceae bacterium]|nr:hypothetical protein [Rhodanobacteraceae bacterium]
MPKPDPAATSVLLNRIIGAEHSLVLLPCGESERLHEQLRLHSIRTGQALYVWSDGEGLRSVREGQLPVPGSRRFIDALRYVAQSVHFGIYFFSGYPQPFDAKMIPLLRQVAKLGGDRVRRIVLMDPATTLPPMVECCELGWNDGANARPRLRDGRWVRA